MTPQFTQQNTAGNFFIWASMLMASCTAPSLSPLSFKYALKIGMVFPRWYALVRRG
jgi:hypothetical protein